MISIALATEDELSENIGIRLIREFLPKNLHINPFRRGGNGYLRSRLTTFCEIARQTPVLLITDLDDVECAPALIKKWKGTKIKKIPDSLLFRVAVHETESWLLADHVALKRFFGKKISRLPSNPDLLREPKSALLKLAEKAPKDIRNDLIVDKGGVAGQGLGYNVRLSDFVLNIWDPERAKSRSDSLKRVCDKLSNFPRIL